MRVGYDGEAAELAPYRYEGAGWSLTFREVNNCAVCLYEREGLPGGKIATEIVVTVHDAEPNSQYVEATIDGLRCRLGRVLQAGPVL